MFLDICCFQKFEVTSSAQQLENLYSADNMLLEKSFTRFGLVDLMPLQVLETLMSLGLENGRFTTGNAAAYLTSLNVNNAHVMRSSDCSLCSSMINL